MIIVNLIIFFIYLFIYFFFPFNKLYMPGSYVAFNLLPSDPFDLLASCIVSLTQRINKYVCMYVCRISSWIFKLDFELDFRVGFRTTRTDTIYITFSQETKWKPRVVGDLFFRLFFHSVGFFLEQLRLARWRLTS